jgi:hypothetical protein
LRCLLSSYLVAKVERTVAVAVAVTTAAVAMVAVATAAVAVMMAAVHDTRGLKAAEGTRNYRIVNGHVPPLDSETGEPSRSDARYALNNAAFVVATGAVLLRFGGRAALISALGLDFATENPELRDGLKAVLGYVPSIGPGGELALFVLAWTAVKVLCLNTGGVNGGSTAAVAMAAVATAAVAVTTAAVATEVVATATVIVTMAAVATAAAAAKTATTATVAAAMTAAAVTVAAAAESTAVAATAKAVTTAATMAASVVAAVTVTATAVGGEDIGSNRDGGGHRQQSTNIGSEDRVAVATAMETAAAGAATTAAGVPTTAPGVGADRIAFATAWEGCGCRL